MKITTAWLKDHLDTKLNENQIIDKLTDIGLEVEGVDSQSGELDQFVIAKILKAEKHPDADRLRVCDVDIGSGKPVKVVCGAPNAKEGLLTIYAPPGAVVPKSQMKLVVSKIRGVTSYGMLCSESELNLSNESDGITELLPEKYNKKVGENYFPKKNLNVIDISITPNRADCLGVRGIARDLAAAGAGRLINQKEKKLDKKNKQTISVKIENEKNQACISFGSCLIKGVKNTESPEWLKDKIIALGQKPISAIVDITNYVMFDLNRPLHAYDVDKIDKGIVVRNSKKGETFEALDNKEYKLEDEMCVISDASGVLGLGGIIELQNPSSLPEPTLIKFIEEPWIKATIITPDQYLGAIIKVCQDKRGVQTNLSYSGNRAVLNYEIPLNEVVFDFNDRLKSMTSGYASFDYEIIGHREGDLVKLGILVNAEPVDALSMMVHKDFAQTVGREVCEKLKDLIPRHNFMIPVQAAIGGKIIARETIKGFKKDVLTKIHGGGARDRKRKLLDKQKKGKARGKQFGKVEIPQEAFIGVLKINKDQ